MSEETEKYKQAWKKFQDKLLSLRKRKSEILENISNKSDQQKIESLRKKIKGDV
jgi:predicted ATP-binding protein involved in virulence